MAYKENNQNSNIIIETDEVINRCEPMRETLSQIDTNTSFSEPSSSKHCNHDYNNDEPSKNVSNDAISKNPPLSGVSKDGINCNVCVGNSEPSTSGSPCLRSASWCASVPYTSTSSCHNMDQNRLMTFTDTISTYLNPEHDQCSQDSFDDLMNEYCEPIREDLNEVDINTLFSVPSSTMQLIQNSNNDYNENNKPSTSSFNETISRCHQIGVNTPNIELSTSSSGQSNQSSSKNDLQSSCKEQIYKYQSTSGASGQIGINVYNTEHSTINQISNNYQPAQCSSNEHVNRSNQREDVLNEIQNFEHSTSPESESESCSSSDYSNQTSDSTHKRNKKLHRIKSVHLDLSKPSTSTQNISSVQNTTNHCNVNDQSAQSSFTQPSTSTQANNSSQSTSVETPQILCPCQNDKLLSSNSKSKGKKNGKNNMCSTHDDSLNRLVPIGLGSVKIRRSDYDRINWTSHTLATRQLLKAVFPPSILATHNLSGKNSKLFQHVPKKKLLNKAKVNDIVNTVEQMCDVNKSAVRGVIALACAQESWSSRCKRKKSKKKSEEVNTTNNSYNDTHSSYESDSE